MQQLHVMIPTIIQSPDRELVIQYIAILEPQNNIVRLEVSPEKTSVSIAQIRELKKRLIYDTQKSTVLVIWDFDTATLEAQNASLKIIEEKNESVHFFFHVTNAESVIPTIRSRCRIIKLGISEGSAVEKDFEDFINKIMLEPSRKLWFASSYSTVSNVEDLQHLLQKILVVLNNNIKKGDLVSAQVAKKTIEILYSIKTFNLSPQLALDSWYISLRRTCIKK